MTPGAEASVSTRHADSLKALGLFRGTNNGYEFPLNDNGTIQPNVSATVNGYYANVIKAYEQDPSRYITVEYNFGECSDSIVEKITVENVTAPVAGEKPNYKWSVRGTGDQMNTAKNNENYGVRNGMQWMTDDWDYVFPNDTFVPGKTYYWFVCGNDTGKSSTGSTD